jgi:hypothetical protein
LWWDHITIAVLSVAAFNSEVVLPLVNITISPMTGDTVRSDGAFAVGRPHGWFGVSRLSFAALIIAVVG